MASGECSSGTTRTAMVLELTSLLRFSVAIDRIEQPDGFGAVFIEIVLAKGLAILD